MNNIRKLAPYLYLTRTTIENQFDLFVLVPVDAGQDVNFGTADNNITRYTIACTIVANNNQTDLYCVRRYTLTKTTQLFVEVICNGGAPLTMKLYFENADSEVASSANATRQLHAPYIFLGQEMIAATAVNYARPSCIVLFDTAVGRQVESVSFHESSCYHTLTCGVAGAVTDPADFTINSDLKTRIGTALPSFESVIEQILPAAAGPGGGSKKRKAMTNTPPFMNPNGRENGGRMGTGEEVNLHEGLMVETNGV